MAGRWYGSVAVLLIVISQPATASADEIRVLASASITGDRVTLGDVCDLSAMRSPLRESIAQAEIATPRHGNFTITGEEIQRALRDAGVNMATTVVVGASQCELSRPARPAPIAYAAFTGKVGGVPPDRAESLRTAVERAFERLARESGGRVELHVGGLADPSVDLSGKDVRYAVRVEGKRWPGRISDVAIDMYDGDELATTTHVAVQARFLRDAVVAKRPINALATIDRDDIEVVERVFNDLNARGVRDPGIVVGQRAKRFIPEGQVIQVKDLEEAPLVNRGEIVTVISTMGGVQVETAGKAVASGALGDVVQVGIGNGRGRTLGGIVTGMRRVVVGHGSTASDWTDRLLSGVR